MNQSLFIDYVKKWFSALVISIVETVNGKKEQGKYLFMSMLKRELSIDGKWTSVSANKSIVAADVVNIDSPLPLKKRHPLSISNGEIPVLGMKMWKPASLIQSIKYMMANPAITEKQVVAQIFDDLVKCVNGIYERLEYMFLYALSHGVVLVDDDKNVGTGIRANFGYLPENTFGATVRWGNDGATPLSDIARVLEVASAKGYTITAIALDRVSYNRLRLSDEAKQLYGASLGLNDGKIVPASKQFDTLFSDEHGVKLLVIDRSIMIEGKDGKQNPVKPFELDDNGGHDMHRLVFLTSEQVGTLVYGMLAENDPEYRNSNAAYQLADSFILTSKYAEIEPLREFTRAQAIAIPIINGAEGIYILDTQDAQEIAATETEGDANITLYGQALAKADVIAALKSVDVKVAANIGDAKLIAKINELSDEQEESLKQALGIEG